jgi:hypothetical protein
VTASLAAMPPKSADGMRGPGVGEVAQLKDLLRRLKAQMVTSNSAQEEEQARLQEVRVRAAPEAHCRAGFFSFVLVFFSKNERRVVN